ncbi:unnamed protein product [Camellia sinensis]
MCTTSSLKTLKHFLSKRPINLCCCSFHVGCFKLQTKFSKTHYPELSFEDSQLLLCLSNNNFEDARDLLEQIPQRDNSSHVVGWTSLLSKYGRDGFVDEARTLFEIMPERNVVTYNAMISTYLQWGRLNDAYRLFEVMPERSVVSWTSMLCGLMNAGMVDQARELFIVMPERNVVSWNSMVVGLVRNGYLEEARRVFDVMPTKNQVSWNAMISGYVEHCRMEEARALFEKMHGYNVITWTSLIAGYCRVGNVEEGYFLFRRMPERNVVSWTAMIGGFGWNGLYRDALLLFIEMRENYDIKPNEPNSHIGQLENAQILFDTVPFRDKISWTSMISGYFSAGKVEEACDFFKRMPDKDDVAWTTMISGYVQNECFAEATCLFAEMRTNGISPPNSTYSVLLGAAGALANLDQGKQFHCLLTKTLPELDLFIENALISMYAKCGEIDDAHGIFSNMISRDLVSWNSMIMGFAHHGLASEALKLFVAMQESVICPNSVTFLGILSACNHAGLVDQGWALFSAMNNEYSNEPGLEHYISMINLLGRAGKLEEAEEFVLSLPFELGHAAWGALLGVCGFGEKNAEMAKRAAQKLLELDPLNVPAFVALRNIYVATGCHIEEQTLRKDMGLKGMKKVPGCSWILQKGRVNVFLSGDRSHPQSDEIFSLLFGIAGESKLQGDEMFSRLSSR